MANERRDSFVISELTLDAINDVLTRIGDQLDELKGLRGKIEVKDVVNTNAGIRYTDTDGTVIHGFGSID